MRKTNDVINRRRKEGQFAQVMHRLRKNKAAMLGLGIVLVLIVEWISTKIRVKLARG